MFFKAGRCLQPLPLGVKLLSERMLDITQTLDRLHQLLGTIFKLHQDGSKQDKLLMDELNTHLLFALPHLLVMRWRFPDMELSIYLQYPQMDGGYDGKCH